jgi:prephenate dehydrogenase
MKKLAIIGLGLMGGSLGLAARRRGLARAVWGFARREQTRRQAVARGIVDRACERPEEAVAGADFVVFCLPVLAIPPVAAACARSLARGCVVTDVGSTKAELMRTVPAFLRRTPAVFVGSHPIAGSEQAGLDAARVDLYDGAVVVVTPPAGREQRAAVKAVTGFWRALGARVVIMDAAEHDRVIASASHLPHLAAAALVMATWRAVTPAGATLCGTGFKDATRIAAGSEDVWHDIVKTNRRHVGRALRDFARIVARAGDLVDRGEFGGLRRFLAEARRKRAELLAPARTGKRRR